MAAKVRIPPTLRRALCALVIAGALVVALGVGPYQWIRARKQAAWPTVEGRIVRTDVEERRGGKGNRLRYLPVLEYAYVVAGREWTSSTFSSGGMEKFRDLEDAQAVQRQYPLGRRVLVHYDPDAPGEAVLEPAPAWESWVLIGIGSLVALGGALGFARTSG